VCGLKIREPFNGISHAGGGVLSLVGLVLLVWLAKGRPVHLTAFLVYGLSLVLLYTASTLYHSLPACPLRLRKLLVFDQVAIYLLIAGTYTPFCLLGVRGPSGTAMLVAAWTIAAVGIILRVGWRSAPEWVPFALYLAMGWMCVLAWEPMVRALSGDALVWIFSGGILYTVGTVILASGRPRLWPGVFSFHEVWHVFVLAGSACHFAAVLRFAGG
jgi:hemolysin III